MLFKRVIIIIIDACGVGELPDASDYGDTGAATIPNISKAVSGLSMPNCRKLGLGNIVPIEGVAPVLDTDGNPIGTYGKMAEQSAGKDSTSGHWEIGGIILEKPFPLFPEGFPRELVKEFEHRAGVSTIGNIPASGTEIIKQLGKEHLETGSLILYTSADSVFQLAAHEDVIPLPRLYEICQIARDLLQNDYGVGRVIARPFIGKPGSFNRTANRRDFSLEPPHETIMDLLIRSDFKTFAIGKIFDLYARRGFTSNVKTSDNDEVMSETINAIKNDRENHFIMSNCVDFDMLWGHRNDVESFAHGLEKFDTRLGELLPILRHDDLLIITADHGCDPTIKSSTDHTREYVPLLVYGEKVKPGVNLGTRETFADIACTLADNFSLEHSFRGKSFLNEIKT